MAERAPLPPTREGMLEALANVRGLLGHIEDHLTAEQQTDEALECCQAHLVDLMVAADSWFGAIDTMRRRMTAGSN